MKQYVKYDINAKKCVSGNTLKIMGAVIFSLCFSTVLKFSTINMYSFSN